MSVESIWEKLKVKDYFIKYMPDRYLHKSPERRYFFGVLATFYPDQLKKLIDDANSKRSTTQIQADSKLIEITPQIKAAIDIVLIGKVSKCKGFQLLKECAKLDRRRPIQHRHEVDLGVFDQRDEEEKKNEMNVDI